MPFQSAIDAQLSAIYTTVSTDRSWPTSEARYRHACQNTSNEHQSGTNPSKTKKSSMYVSPSRSNDLVHSSAASPPKNGPSDIRLLDSSKYFGKLNSTITVERSTFLAASAVRRTTIPKSLDTFIVIGQRQKGTQDCRRSSLYGRVSETGRLHQFKNTLQGAR